MTVHALAATVLYMHVIWVTPALAPVYARHFREAEFGAERRALEQAEQLALAAELAGVSLALLAAVREDESHFDDDLVGDAGELGGMQLLPGTRWWRGWLNDCWSAGDLHSRCDDLNVLWGAYALRAALDACGGDEHAALGRYRSGRCVRGPRGQHTLELAEWIAHQLNEPISTEMVSVSRTRGASLQSRGCVGGVVCERPPAALATGLQRPGDSAAARRSVPSVPRSTWSVSPLLRADLGARRDEASGESR